MHVQMPMSRDTYLHMIICKYVSLIFNITIPKKWIGDAHTTSARLAILPKTFLTYVVSDSSFIPYPESISERDRNRFESVHIDHEHHRQLRSPPFCHSGRITIQGCRPHVHELPYAAKRTLDAEKRGAVGRNCPCDVLVND